MNLVLNDHQILSSLANELNKVGIRCRVVNLNPFYYKFYLSQKDTIHLSKEEIQLHRFISRFVFARPLRPVYKPIVLANLTRYFTKNKIDTVIANWHLPEIAMLAKKGYIKFIFWDVETPMVPYEAWVDLLSYANHVFTYNKTAEKVWRDQGIKVKWLPLCYDPSIFYPLRSLNKKIDILLAASNLKDRKEGKKFLLYPLIRRFGKRITIVGPRWERDIMSKYATTLSPVSLNVLNVLYNTSRVCLNIHRDPARNAELALNMRTFEVSGSGSLLISDYVQNMESMFENKRDLVIARDSNEALELVEYYLDNPEERRKIALTGHEKVLKEHTIRHRVQYFVNALKLL